MRLIKTIQKVLSWLFPYPEDKRPVYLRNSWGKQDQDKFDHLFNGR